MGNPYPIRPGHEENGAESGGQPVPLKATGKDGLPMKINGKCQLGTCFNPYPKGSTGCPTRRARRRGRQPNPTRPRL